MLLCPRLPSANSTVNPIRIAQLHLSLESKQSECARFVAHQAELVGSDFGDESERLIEAYSRAACR